MACKLAFNPNIHQRSSIRLKGYDYAQAGLYFITICCHGRVCHFGTIENDEMVLNEFGRIAHNEWLKTPKIRPHVALHDFVIMPNHIHGIIQIIHTPRGVLHTPTLNTPPVLNTPTLNTPTVLNTPPTNPSQIQDTSNTSKQNPIPRRGVLNTPTLNTPPVLNTPTLNTHVKGVCNTPLRSPSQTIGAIIRGYKSSVTKQLNLIGFAGRLWQRNYYEHVIRTERSYLHISKYIFDNPKNWHDDVFFLV